MVLKLESTEGDLTSKVRSTSNAAGWCGPHGRPLSARLAHCPESRRRSVDRTDTGRSALDAGTGLHVKGFRTPAPSLTVRRAPRAGVRKASGEETAGRVCAGSGVGLWGFSAAVCRDLAVSNRDD